MASATQTTGTRSLRTRSGEAADFADGIRRAAAMGAIGYAGFGAVDALLHFLAYERAPLDRVVAYRIAGVSVLFGWYFYARAARAALRAMVASTAAVLAVTAVLLALIAAQLGGLESPYVQGTAFYFVAIAVLVPSPWRRILAILVP